MMDVSLGSDGECSGLQWLVDLLPWKDAVTACCVGHDAGQSDGWLLDCLQAGLPAWAWVPAGLLVVLMIAARPIYNWLQRRGVAR